MLHDYLHLNTMVFLILKGFVDDFLLSCLSKYDYPIEAAQTAQIKISIHDIFQLGSALFRP